MKPYQRVASRYVKAKYQKGNITIKPSTNYASEWATLGVELLEDGEYMGHCEASVETYTLEDLSHFVCGDDIEKLSKEYWFKDEMLYTYSAYHDDFVVHVVEVVDSFLHPLLRGQKCGLQMYVQLAREAFNENKRLPLLFIPNYCNERSTSNKALRVWKSFAKKYRSEGDVIVIDKTPYL